MFRVKVGQQNRKARNMSHSNFSSVLGAYRRNSVWAMMLCLNFHGRCEDIVVTRLSHLIVTYMQKKSENLQIYYTSLKLLAGYLIKTTVDNHFGRSNPHGK